MEHPEQQEVESRNTAPFSGLIAWAETYIPTFQDTQHPHRTNFGRWRMGLSLPQVHPAKEAASLIWTTAKAELSKAKFAELRREVSRLFPGMPKRCTASRFSEIVGDYVANVRQSRRRSSDMPSDESETTRPPSRPATSVLPWLILPQPKWDSEYHGYCSLLCPEFRVVPFHGEGRQEELGRLEQWCSDPRRRAFRSFSGAGGIGKTRVGVELCHRLLASHGDEWHLGFFKENLFPATTSPWDGTDLRGRSLLVVIDYAADPRKKEALANLFEAVEACPAQRIRLLFLEREHLWFGRLWENAAARRVLNHTSLEQDAFDSCLDPVAATAPDRAFSFATAYGAFSEKLCNAGSPAPGDLTARIYDQVLLLHCQALLDVLDSRALNREGAILDALLARERAYWRRILYARGMPEDQLPLVQQGCVAIAMDGGAASLDAAISVFKEEPLLSDQPNVVLHQVAGVLQECYPSPEGGIAPLQPDLLMQQLIARCLREG